MAEVAVKRALTRRLTLWIHTINVNLQSNVPIYITTVTYKQQKLSNVVNLKCKVYQQAFNVASNKNTYRFLAIHQYIIPIHVYITPMCMSIITKILLKATILSPLTALILPCKGKLTITHLLMSRLIVTVHCGTIPELIQYTVILGVRNWCSIYCN